MARGYVVTGLIIIASDLPDCTGDNPANKSANNERHAFTHRFYAA